MDKVFAICRRLLHIDQSTSVMPGNNTCDGTKWVSYDTSRLSLCIKGDHPRSNAQTTSIKAERLAAEYDIPASFREDYSYREVKAIAGPWQASWEAIVSVHT